jgi:dipeptidyl aminopeptidase/acylaminoacyl peptidase
MTLRTIAVFLIISAIAPPDFAEQLQTRLESVTFSNNNVTLAGTLYLPEKVGPHPALVVYHSASGPLRNHPAYQHLITELPPTGFAVLVFDRRGSGASTGDFNTATFQDLAMDGIAGISYLKKRKDIDPTRIGVWG